MAQGNAYDLYSQGNYAHCLAHMKDEPLSMCEVSCVADWTKRNNIAVCQFKVRIILYSVRLCLFSLFGYLS